MPTRHNPDKPDAQATSAPLPLGVFMVQEGYRNGLSAVEVSYRMAAHGYAPEEIEECIRAAGAEPATTNPPPAAPPQPAPQDPADDPASASFASRSEALSLWWDNSRQEFCRRNARGQWQHIAETAFKHEMAIAGMSTRPAKGEVVSEFNRFCVYVRNRRDVDYSGPLAGHHPGLYEQSGRRILVTIPPIIPQPAPAPTEPVDFFTLYTLVDNLLRIDDANDQTPYFWGWLSWAYRALRSGKIYPGQALAIAGPRECGKSLLQQIITVVLGGRSAKPYQFMTGATPFNSDLFWAEHLAIEDEVASSDLRMRRSFGASLKQIAANIEQRCHAKGREAIILRPFWRVTITLNDEPENLMVLPPLDDSIEDKLMILRAAKRTLPMPAESPDEKDALWATLTAEIPALCRWLLDYQVPAEHRSSRYGVTHHHDPDLKTALYSLSRESHLMEMIRETVLDAPGLTDWHGTSEELAKVLTASDSPVSRPARELLTWPGACGTYLGRLAKRFPKLIEAHQEGADRARMWTIHKST